MAATAALPKPAACGPGQVSSWAGLRDSAAAYALAGAAANWELPIALLASDPQEADRWHAELSFFLGDSLPLILFPDRETLPYDKIAPNPDLVSERLRLLNELPGMRRGIVIAPLSAALHRLPPPAHCAAALRLRPGDRMDTIEIRDRLARCGYRFVQQVAERGEVAVRGSLIDVFPMGSASGPCRIDLDDDRVEQVRWFDAATQRSTGQAEELTLLPAAEVPLSEAAMEGFRVALRELCTGNPMDSSVYRGVREGRLPAGVEYYMPLFFADAADLFDYLPANSVVAHEASLPQAASDFYADADSRYQRLLREYPEEPLPPPGQLFLDEAELQRRCRSLATILLQEGAVAGADFSLDAHRVPPVTVDPRAPDPFSLLRRFLRRHGDHSVLLSCESKGAMEALLDNLGPSGLQALRCDDFSDFVARRPGLGVAPQALDRGMLLAEERIAVFGEPHLYGSKIRRRRARGRRRSAAEALRNLAELAMGSAVVHEDHGVGRYQGLEVIEHNGRSAEFILLQYAGEDRLYVPVMLANRIQRYSGADPEQAPLHSLSGGLWQRSKARAARQARDTAAELLELQARREARQRPPFALQEEQAAFRAAFNFTETADQEQAIDDVLADLQAQRPMDRLVAGDAGFGKTEVAMNAAFAVVSNGHQVAIMAPTTLLVQQHYRNFRDRFADWPVRVAQLSRFVSSGDADGVVSGLREGELDIVIGTHALLNKKIRYKRLGLIIIDEEHRFGVRQKERIKSLRAQTDVLSLTATPIPRTLDMALSGIRDISIISTPPARRQPVATEVRQWDPVHVSEAVARELRRGGQVFFVHNRVQTMEQAVRRLRSAVPGLDVRVAHGQMRERDLERIMTDFSHRRFPALACTAIIENGIDIPTANTMIVDEAHKLGLAQLYQLRGRVGRSHHNAYAYFITPPPSAMNEQAKHRLEAICAMDTLGIGLGLALQDLEIRGAGVLLGEEQSGHINSIGYGAYLDLVRRAVAELRQSGDLDSDLLANRLADIEIPFAALLPEDYIPDVQHRLRLYRRMASMEQEELSEWRMELVDRYGKLPEEADTLLRLHAIRLQAEALGVKRIWWDARGGHISFSDDCRVDPQWLVSMVQDSPGYRLADQNSIHIAISFDEARQQCDFISELLARMQR